jgi:hypothetical protein
MDPQPDLIRVVAPGLETAARSLDRGPFNSPRASAENRSMNSPIVRHMGVPSLLSIAMLALYYTPVSVFGCANRGRFAVGVAALGMLGSIVTLVPAYRLIRSDRVQARWWWINALVFLLPAILLIRLA